MLNIFKHKPGKLCIVFIKADINKPDTMTYTFSENNEMNTQKLMWENLLPNYGQFMIFYRTLIHMLMRVFD